MTMKPSRASRMERVSFDDDMGRVEHVERVEHMEHMKRVDGLNWEWRIDLETEHKHVVNFENDTQAAWPEPKPIQKWPPNGVVTL